MYMTFKIFLSFLIVSSIIIILGCTQKGVDPKMLIGSYCFNEGNDNDSLFLYADKTYTHKFIASNAKVFEAKGEWRYDSLGNEVTFEDFIFFNDEGADNPPGLWYSKVSLTKEGEIRLIYSSENNIFFSKK